MTLKLESKFGKYGGQFVPEVLMPALVELTEYYENIKMTLFLMMNWIIISGILQVARPHYIMQKD